MRLQADFAIKRGALDLRVNLDVGREAAVIIGPNGAGKTTLLLGLLGLVAPDRGRIVLGQTVLLDTAAGLNLPTEKRRLAYVPQADALFPHLTAKQNVEFALGCLVPAPPMSDRREAAGKLLEELGASAYVDHRPAALSGGQRQRVALARALATAPQALLFDEPLAALDAGARAEVRAFLGERLKTLGLPALFVTHERRDAEAIGDTVIALEQGQVVQQGSLQDLTAHPASPFIARFCGEPKA